MRVSATTPKPLWVKPLTSGSVAGGPQLLFDWEDLGLTWSALRFVVINDGAGLLTVTPEAGYTSAGPASAGALAPVAFTVAAGQAYGDPYGIDEMRPWWRVWISGTSSYRWGVLGLERTT